jgi:hypothetical protein
LGDIIEDLELNRRFVERERRWSKRIGVKETF